MLGGATSVADYIKELKKKEAAAELIITQAEKEEKSKTAPVKAAIVKAVIVKAATVKAATVPVVEEKKAPSKSFVKVTTTKDKELVGNVQDFIEEQKKKAVKSTTGKDAKLTTAVKEVKNEVIKSILKDKDLVVVEKSEADKKKQIAKATSAPTTPKIVKPEHITTLITEANKKMEKPVAHKPTIVKSKDSDAIVFHNSESKEKAPKIVTDKDTVVVTKTEAEKAAPKKVEVEKVAVKKVEAEKKPKTTDVKKVEKLIDIANKQLNSIWSKQYNDSNQLKALNDQIAAAQKQLIQAKQQAEKAVKKRDDAIKAADAAQAKSVEAAKTSVKATQHAEKIVTAASVKKESHEDNSEWAKASKMLA